jgi:hypothetical protein
VQVAKFRSITKGALLNENDVIIALREIYDYYYLVTGESYIKTFCNKAGAFKNK